MNTRSFVIESTILIDEFLSFVICEILKIDTNITKSFGHGSTALSFNQKVQLFSDIKIVTAEEKKKFVKLLEIRNKFAHVSSIDSFTNLFKLEIGQEVLRDFKKWYNVNDEKETTYLLCFSLLCKELNYTIQMVYEKHMYQVGCEKGNADSYKELLDNMLQYFKTKIITI